MASGLGSAMLGLATVLRANVGSLQVYEYPPDAPLADPCCFMVLEDPVDYEIALQGHTFTATVRCTFLLVSGDTPSGFLQMYDYIDPTATTKSVYKAVETDRTLDGAVDDAHVVRAENIGRRTFGGANYFGFDAIVEFIKTVA